MDLFSNDYIETASTSRSVRSHEDSVVLSDEDAPRQHNNNGAGKSVMNVERSQAEPTTVRLAEPSTSSSPVYNVPPMESQLVAKKIFLTSANDKRKLRFAYAFLAVLAVLAAALICVGGYHTVQAHLRLDDGPTSALDGQQPAPIPAGLPPVAGAQLAPVPAAVLSESVAVLQLGLIALFVSAVGMAAYFPYDTRRPSKTAFLILTTVLVRLLLQTVGATSDELAQRVAIDKPLTSYRVAELVLMLLIGVCLIVVASPACSSFVNKFEKQTRPGVRALYVGALLLGLIGFVVYVALLGYGLQRARDSPFWLTISVRLTFAADLMPAAVFASLLSLCGFVHAVKGSRAGGLWLAMLMSATLLCFYEATPRYASMLDTVQYEQYDNVYRAIYGLHCTSVILATGVIMAASAFAFVR